MTLEWNGYVTDDYLRLRLEGGATRLDSDGIGPALTGCDWRIWDGRRELSLRLRAESIGEIGPGNHIELEMTLFNHGKTVEEGIFQMILPPDISISNPDGYNNRTLTWRAKPGEEVRQPVVIAIEPTYETAILRELNYRSVSVCMETYWLGHRALLSVSLPFAAPGRR